MGGGESDSCAVGRVICGSGGYGNDSGGVICGSGYGNDAGGDAIGGDSGSIGDSPESLSLNGFFTVGEMKCP